MKHHGRQKREDRLDGNARPAIASDVRQARMLTSNQACSPTMIFSLACAKQAQGNPSKRDRSCLLPQPSMHDQTSPHSNEKKGIVPGSGPASAETRATACVE